MNTDISLRVFLKSNINIWGLSLSIIGFIIFIVLSIVVIIFIIFSCSKTQEGYISNNINIGVFTDSLRNNMIEMKKAFNDRKPIFLDQDPKKKSDLDFFYGTEFKPLCCDRKDINYSSSDGCPCLTLKQKLTFITRGNNNN